MTHTDPISLLQTSTESPKSIDGILEIYQEQRASAFMAGARSILIDSPETDALATTFGRMTARAMKALGVHEKLLNYIRFRPYGIMEMARRLVRGKYKPRLLDPFHGYAPHWIWLAREDPNYQVIAMDMPEVVRDVRMRLCTIPGFRTPLNLHWIDANLKEIPLEECLGGKKVDMIESIGSYIPHNEYRTLLQYLMKQVSPGGAILGVLPYEPAVEEARQLNSVITSMFINQVSKVPGLISSKDQAIAFYESVGLTGVQAITMSELAEEMGHDLPISLELWVTGRVKEDA